MKVIRRQQCRSQTFFKLSLKLLKVPLSHCSFFKSTNPQITLQVVCGVSCPSLCFLSLSLWACSVYPSVFPYAGPGVRHVAHLLSPFNSSLHIRLFPLLPLFQPLITSWSGSIFANALEMSRGHRKACWNRFMVMFFFFFSPQHTVKKTQTGGQENQVSTQTGNENRGETNDTERPEPHHV